MLRLLTPGRSPRRGGIDKGDKTMRLRTSFAVLAMALGFVGCATTSTDSQQDTPGATSSTTGTQSATSTVPGTRGSVDLTGSQTGTATDGQGVDLKRSVYYEFDQYDVKPQ